MEARKLTGILLVCAVFYPAIVTCQSRGEASFRGSSSIDSGYLRQSQLQSNSRVQPEYYQPQSYNPPYNARSQVNYNSYPNQPAQFSQINSQSPYVQQFAQNYDRPAPVNTPYIPRPQSFQNNNYQTQQSSNLANRFGPEEASDPFTQRATKSTRHPATTVKPPVYLTTKFDEGRDNPNFQKKLAFDPDLSSSMEIFGLKLLQHMHARFVNDNFMFSPFSVYHLLVLIAEGAKGKTFNEINNELNLVSLERTRDFQQYLNVALNKNTADVILRKFAMMVTDRNRPVEIRYEDTIEKVYEADVMSVNFLEVDKTLRDINDKVSNWTLGQIGETVTKDDLFKAQLILISGLVFKGQWMNIFNTSFTKQEPFFDTNGTQTGAVKMMFQRGPFAYAAIAELGCHVIELPYADQPLANRNDIPASGLSMILVLPRKGLSLEEAIEKVYEHGMEKLYRELRNAKVEYEEDEVEVHIPRFEITTSLDLKETLEGLGIKELFSQGRADLSNINSQYFVSSMIHKTKISVDEKGTTAAAVTTSIFANKATPPKFHANKPFLFFIVDKVTKLILFGGQYSKPELF